MPTFKTENIELNRDTERKCLSCYKPFMSWGIGNRVCDNCKHTSLYEGSAVAEYPHGLKIFKS